MGAEVCIKSKVAADVYRTVDSSRSEVVGKSPVILQKDTHTAVVTMAPTPHTLHTDVIPGTVHLVDLAGTLQVKHNEAGQKDIILLPQPTNEYDDPLNWSRRRKLLSVMLLLLAVFSADIMTTLLSAALLDIEAETGIPLATLNQGISVQYLFFGWSTYLVWQPFGLTFGRRPAFLIGGLGMLACSVWTSYVKSGAEWYANRVLIGFFYGPIETLIEVCISDIFLAHDRGFWIGMYCWILFGIPFLGAVPAGFIAQNIGWKWIQFIASIIAAACLVAMIFFQEETMFYRPPVQEEALDVDEESASDKESTEKTASRDEKNPIGSQSQPPTRLGETSTKKSYAQKLKFWGARRPGQPNNYWLSMWLPIALLQFPVAVFSGVLVGSVLSWFNVVNGTAALVLAAPPYNFSTEMIGVMFIAPFIGCTVGCAFAGVSANRFAVWMSRRKGASSSQNTVSGWPWFPFCCILLDASCSALEPTTACTGWDSLSAWRLWLAHSRSEAQSRSTISSTHIEKSLVMVSLP